ncbi:MAG: aldo/keto reductase [Chloroflexota bacterium]|jgi:aryl-alcohol dehydrogenase-like predicted oxidoreductase|nr:aldo/keto reductase [Chloroflexota bacterium]MDP6757210.1 aldo/keto reductase [Chloroflexota bacterium]
MELTELGSTGLLVSRLCFGTGLLGRLEHDYPDGWGGHLLRYAHDRGVNFWDTAHNYGSHRHVRAGLSGLYRSGVIINTKTDKKSKADGKAEIDSALDEMGIDYVDSMMLHAVRDRADFESRRGCLEALLEAKADGRVRHVGATTHVYTGEALETLIEAPEIEVVLSHLNKAGQSLQGGSLEDHITLLKRVREAGKGLMIMKILDQKKFPEGEAEEWIRWASISRTPTA